MKKFILVFALFITLSTNVQAGKPDNFPWNGIWEYGRYSTDLSGSLNITDCQNNQCVFQIDTASGAHTCSLSGQIKINGNTGEYRKKSNLSDGKDDEIIVTFELDNTKKIITIDANFQSQIYCGLQGQFTGKYENEHNPLRYDTGFDCWNKNITETEKTICSSKNLATANREMLEKHPNLQTKEWYQQRETCRNNENCLWAFYISSIQSSYETEHKHPLNLYDYMGKLSENSVFYPTDFSLLTDFFIKNMPKDDYNEWTATFSQIAMDNNQCDNCYYRQYGVAGIYTIMESAFYIDKDTIWIAFLHTDDEDKDKYIVMYALADYTEKDIPASFHNWLERLKPYFPNGIKLKHFIKKASE
jgi:hypothetical protein